MDHRVAWTVVRGHWRQEGRVRLKPTRLGGYRGGGGGGSEGWQDHWARSRSDCRMIEVVDMMSWPGRRKVPDWIWSSGYVLRISDSRRGGRMMSRSLR